MKNYFIDLTGGAIFLPYQLIKLKLKNKNVVTPGFRLARKFLFF